MTKVQQLIEFLDDSFPPALQEKYDNSGFLIGNPDNLVSGVLITLDITPECIQEAIDNNLNFIISHHPLIFSGIKRITPADQTGRLIQSIIHHQLNIYAAHTNLDNLFHGVNGILAKKLGLTDCHILRPSNPTNPSVGAGMVGTLPSPISAQQLATQLKATLSLPLLRSSAPISPSLSPIQRIAICGGSGAFLIDDAKLSGAQAYLTGDLKYHDFQHAAPDILLLDIGHYESEQFAKELFYSAISKKFSNFACRISERSHSFVHYI